MNRLHFLQEHNWTDNIYKDILLAHIRNYMYPLLKNNNVKQQLFQNSNINSLLYYLLYVVTVNIYQINILLTLHLT